MATVVDADGNPMLGVIPDKLPGIGWDFDPNANNTDRVQLHYTDENGQPQTRYYDDKGNQVQQTGHRVCGSPGLGSDYAQYAEDAIAPTFVVQMARENFTEQAGLAAGMEQEIDRLQREASSNDARWQLAVWRR